MKIKFDSSIFQLQKFGGISRYFFELSNEIHSLNLNDEINILAPIYTNEYIRKSKFVHGYYVNEYPKYTRKLCRKINNIISEFDDNLFDYDICHMTYYTKNFKKSKSKKVITVYDMIHEIFPDNFSVNDATRHNKKTSIDKCDHVICISESTKIDLMNILNVPEEKISVTYLGVNSYLDHGISSEINNDYILYVGSRNGYKNFNNLIKAYAINIQIKNIVKLFVFGGGNFTNDEVSLFKNLGINERYIIHVGWDDSILNSLYKNALAFIYPSIYEGFGLPPLEAMIRECPVAVSNTSSIPEVVGDAGLYFNPNSIEDISHALSRIIFDDSLRETLISKGQERVKQFTWTNCAVETRKIYENLL